MNYEKLHVWQKAMDLVTFVYRATQHFPSCEIYGLTSQIRRSTVSIASNIAEGSRRRTKGEFGHFVGIAYGSGAELETQLEICRRLELLKIEEFQTIKSLLTEVMKMLNKLNSTLK